VQGNFLRGGLGNDTLRSGLGEDTLVGASGADLLDGGGGANDFAFYFDSNGQIVGHPSDVIAALSVGGGSSVAQFEAVYGVGSAATLGAGFGVRVDLTNNATNLGWAQGDVLTGIEHILGSGLNDHLIGDAFANSLAGGAGADTLEGGAGVDTLNGGGGNDVLVGGAGVALGDILDGGDGTDRLLLDSASVDFSVLGTGGYNRFIGIERVDLRSGAFTLTLDLDNLIGNDYRSALNPLAGPVAPSLDPTTGLTGLDASIGNTLFIEGEADDTVNVAASGRGEVWAFVGNIDGYNVYTASIGGTPTGLHLAIDQDITNRTGLP